MDLHEWLYKKICLRLRTGFLILMLFFPGVIAQCQDGNTRPKLGLALSGGGSCGIAQVGVLKVMEEAGLRPDYITGVSMGSVIGGLYAMGYTADSIEKIFRVTNWDQIMSNQIPESKIIYPEKEHFYNSIISLPIAFNGIVLPSGLNNGQQLENMLGYYTWPAASINHFSDLPIPFICLATDLVTCKQVILDKGCLADAIRSSATVPTIFTPLKIDNEPLIDGGMVRNLAVSEVRKMGANVVIGVYTGSYMTKKEKLRTIKDVMAQLLFFVGVYDFQDQKKFADILIEPKTDDIPSTSFSDIDTLINRGYKAALPFKETFKRLADSLNLLGPQPPPENILDRQYYYFDRIIVTGNKRVSRSQILKELDIKCGQKTDKNTLRERIDLIYGNAWFEKVKYRIISRNDSTLLILDCTEAPLTTIYGSVHYDDAMHTGVVLGVTIRNPLLKRSLVDVNSYLGHYYKVDADYIQYFDKEQKISIGINLYAENTYIPRLDFNNEAGGTFNRIFSQRIELKKRFGLNQMLDLSCSSEMRNLIPDFISYTGLRRINHHILSVTVGYGVNTLNTKYFPDRGIDAHFSLSNSEVVSSKTVRDSSTVHFNKDSGFKSFYTFRGCYNQFFPLSDRLALGVRLDLLSVSKTDTISAGNNFFFLGGYESINSRTIPMQGYHVYQIPVKRVAGLSMNMDYEMKNKLHLELTASLFTGNEIDSPDKATLYEGLGVGAGYLTLFGPLRAGLMYGFNTHLRYFNLLKGYISLGYNF